MHSEEQSVGGALFQTSGQVGGALGFCLSALTISEVGSKRGQLLQGLRAAFYLDMAAALLGERCYSRFIAPSGRAAASLETLMSSIAFGYYRLQVGRPGKGRRQIDASQWLQIWLSMPSTKRKHIDCWKTLPASSMEQPRP